MTIYMDGYNDGYGDGLEAAKFEPVKNEWRDPVNELLTALGDVCGSCDCVEDGEQDPDINCDFCGGSGWGGPNIEVNVAAHTLSKFFVSQIFPKQTNKTG